MSTDHTDILASVTALQKSELSIIRLSEPISSTYDADPAKRTSNISSDAFENPSPASLAADLSHYKELFSKLRFSYLEQVTKEKFLRAIVGDPPQIVENQENIELEAQLVGVKAGLKAQKVEVAALVEELEARGRALSKRYESIQLQTSQLSTLPSHISHLTSTISSLQSSLTPSPSANPSLTLPLPATLSLLSSRQTELDQLNSQLKTLQQAVPRKKRELEKLQTELKPLETQRDEVMEAAKEAKRRKDEGERGIGDELELKGRWYQGVETGLREMLGVEG